MKSYRDVQTHISNIAPQFRQRKTKDNNPNLCFLKSPKSQLSKLFFLSQAAEKRSCDISTMDCGTLKSFREAFESKESKVRNKSRTLAHQKIESTIEKISTKQKKILQHKLNVKREQTMEAEKISTLSSFRRLKRKISRLIASDPIIVCRDFQNSNKLFNDKFLHYLTSPLYYTHSKEYHRNFHFHSNDLSESHNKFDMIIDFDKFKQGQLSLTHVLKESLTQSEIELVRHDPAYFLSRTELLKQPDYKMVSLSKKLLEEEEKEAKRKQKAMQTRQSLFQFNEVKQNHKTKQSQSPPMAFDPRFNWTDFDGKISAALNILKRRLNKAHSLKELKKFAQPEMPIPFTKELDKTLTSIYKHKRRSALTINYNHLLPMNQQRDYLNYAVVKRMKNASKKYKERQESLIVQGNADSNIRMTLEKIRDNIIADKNSIFRSEQNLFKFKLTKSI